MEGYVYLAKFLDKSSDHSIYILNRELKCASQRIDTFTIDPKKLFKDDPLMKRMGIIASANVAKRWKNSRLYCYPFSSCVYSGLRGKGYGVLLYKSILQLTKLICSDIKTKPLLAQHSAIEPRFGPTSKDASYIYNALEGRGYIEHFDELSSYGISGDAFKIIKYPTNQQTFLGKYTVDEMDCEIYSINITSIS